MKTTRYTLEKIKIDNKIEVQYAMPRDFEVGTVTQAAKILWNPRMKTVDDLVTLGYKAYSFFVRHKEGKKRGQIVRKHTYYFKSELDFKKFLIIVESQSGGLYNYTPHNTKKEG